MLLEHLALPEVPRTVFERTPLVLTICQVKYTPLYSVADQTFVGSFQRAIQSTYPIARSSQNVELELGLAAGQASFRQVQPAHQWEFTDSDSNWTVVLATESISLETRAYQDFSVFLTRLEQILHALAEAFEVTVGTRIGLRYVNEIRLPSPHDLSAVRHEMLGPLSESAFQLRAEQAIQLITLRYPDDQGITIRHGRIASGTSVRPRPQDQAADDPFYLLDFDVYREFPQVRPLTMDPKIICDHVSMFHAAIWRLFMWSVTDEYVSSLGELK